MLHLKEGVVVDGLAQEMFYALGLADQAYADEGLECIVTSAKDSHHNVNSIHGQGLAVDLHNSDLQPDQYDRIWLKLKRLEKYGFDVIKEVPGSTAATTGPHFHIEFQPKSGETFWHS